MSCTKTCSKPTFIKLVNQFFAKRDYNETPYMLMKHYLKLIIAGIIAAIGLATNSGTTIVGSMLISPLGDPLSRIIFYFYSVKKSKKFLAEHLYYFIIDVIILFIIGMLFGRIFDFLYKKYEHDDDILREFPTDEMYNRTGIVNIISSGIVAFLAGILLFNSYLSKDLTYLIGIGIATSFLPPLVNSGMLFHADPKMYKSSLYIFLISCLTISLSVMSIPYLLLPNLKFVTAIQNSLATLIKKNKKVLK